MPLRLDSWSRICTGTVRNVHLKFTQISFFGHSMKLRITNAVYCAVSIQRPHPKMAKLVTFDKYHWHSSPPTFSVHFTMRIEIPAPIPVYILNITVRELCMNFIAVMRDDGMIRLFSNLKCKQYLTWHDMRMIWFIIKNARKICHLQYQFVECRHFIATATDHTLIQQQLKCTVVYSNHITKVVPNPKQCRIGQMFVVLSVNINSTTSETTRSFARSVDWLRAMKRNIIMW